jgi:hypothetical protein
MKSPMRIIAGAIKHLSPFTHILLNKKHIFTLMKDINKDAPSME